MSITPNKNRATNALAAYRQRERKRLHYDFAVLGNNAGTVETADDGIIWVQLHGDPNQVCRALTASSIPCEDGDAGTTVKVEKLKRYAGGVRYRVLGLASEIQPGDPRNTLVARHAAQHKYADFNTGGADPVDVHADAVIALRAQPQAAPNMTLYVSPGVYQKPDGTAGKYNGGNSGAFAACALLERRCDLLYLASNGTTLTILEGTPTVDGSQPTRPTTPGNCTPIVWVWLDSSVTALDSFAYLESCRFMIGSSLSGVAAAAHNILSATHSDTLAAAIVAGDLLIGNATPKLARLAAGAQYKVLTMGAALPEWSAYLLQGTAGQTYVYPATSTTIAGLSIAQTFTAAQKINVNSTTALFVEQDGVKDNVFIVDTTNARVGINKVPVAVLDIAAAASGASQILLDATNTLTDDGITYRSGFISSATGEPIFAIVRGAAGLTMFSAGVHGDTYRRFVITNDGIIQWGAGNVARDVTLQRSAAQMLQTMANFNVQGSLSVGAASTAAKFTLTQAVDSNVGGIYISNVGGGRTLRLWVDATNNIRFDGGATGTGNVIFNSGGTGYVGIGGTPSAAMHIIGTSNVQQFLCTGYSTQTQATALGAFVRNDTAAGISDILALTGLGSGANNDGIAMDWFQKTSTTTQQMARIRSYWVDATLASRKAAMVLSAWDTAERDALTIGANGSAATLAFYGGTLVARGAALTAQLTTLTHTAPGTPDYALQDLIDSSAGACFGFATKDEGNTALSCIANLQVRVAELEARLGSATGVNLFA